jgi:hypothetical protein
VSSLNQIAPARQAATSGEVLHRETFGHEDDGQAVEPLAGDGKQMARPFRGIGGGGALGPTEQDGAELGVAPQRQQPVLVVLRLDDLDAARLELLDDLGDGGADGDP